MGVNGRPPDGLPERRLQKIQELSEGIDIKIIRSGSTQPQTNAQKIAEKKH